MTIIDQNTSLESCPALVLNADYRPLSYYPLSLWNWQDSIKLMSKFDHLYKSWSQIAHIPSGRSYLQFPDRFPDH